MVPKRLLHLGVDAALHIGIVLSALLSLTGCPRQQGPIREAPLRLEGVPTIRVLVSSGESIRVSTSGPYTILADGREIASSMDPLPEGILTRHGDRFSLHAAVYAAKSFTLATPSHWRGAESGNPRPWRSCVRIGSTAYRGSAAFHPDTGRRGILAVNHVNLESYLAGVLGRELYANWHIRTYRAQAIAARTYAMYEMATLGKQRLYDLRDDQSSQVYGGFTAETDKSWRAVRETHGIVLATGATGNEKIFRAHYSACCGGKTNSVYVLYGPPVTEGPLAGGQTCTDCEACSRYRWPPVRVPKSVIHMALGRTYPQVAKLRGVNAIEVVEELNGRPVWIDVVGLGGSKVRIRADDFRLALLRDQQPSAHGLYSMNCRIRDAGDAVAFEQGRGFGHGVGMCQWGAQAKAARGATAAEILADYYPGAKLFRAY